MKKKRISIILGSWKYILLIVIVIGFLSPIFWIFLQSFKNAYDVINNPPLLIFKPTLVNYFEVLKTPGFLKSFLDSLIVSVFSVILCLILGVPFGYVLARYKFRGNNDIGFFILSLKMLPPIIVIIPLIKIFSFLKLVDTYPGLIFSHVLINIALIVWLSRGFFNDIPRELEEAAFIDGSSSFRAFFTIVLPLAVPGIVSASILAFLFSWNDLLFGITLASFNVKPLPVFMATNFVGYYTVNWGGISAAGVMVIIPSIIFIALIQRFIVRGLTFGAVK